ncbi:MAG: alpha-L-rhamnosidase N-terminal domain-containing protein [Phycisphaerae bacterium]|nr:alpha-L-rhamnosidase N-terminal domain-containing protein [Phycisphaerae bacterium]
MNALRPFAARVSWIWSDENVSGVSPVNRDPVVTRYFRRTFDAFAGQRLVVYISADSRYKLFCNGVLVARGPAKGDIAHHFYETVDLTAHLRAGRNVLAAQVQFYGQAAPNYYTGGPLVSVMTHAPGLVVQARLSDAAGFESQSLDSDERWRVLADTACRHHGDGPNCPCAGWLEDFDAAQFPWGWTGLEFDDSAWPAATPIDLATMINDGRQSVMPHQLLPRMIAMLDEQAPRGFARAYGATGAADLAAWQTLLRGAGVSPALCDPLACSTENGQSPSPSGAGKMPARHEGETPSSRETGVTIPAGQSASVWFDAGANTTGYPRLQFAGRGEVTLTYMESPIAPDGTKPNRNAEGDWQPTGQSDRVLCDGSHTYEPFWWRTFRFVHVRVQAGETPLTIAGLRYAFTAYPLAPRAAFECSDAAATAVWENCWRTQVLCSHETYEDCPYYEQLQYGGDTQVQCMNTYAAAGDATLARQFLYQFDWSRQPSGLTRSRYPSRIPQTIPYWSHHWVMTLAEYWQYTADRATVADLLPGVLNFADYLERRVTPAGVIGRLDGWLVADWSPDWGWMNRQHGAPPGASQGQGAYDSLISIAALSSAATVVEAVGGACLGDRAEAVARELRGRLERLRQAVVRVYYDAAEDVYLDRPRGDLTDMEHSGGRRASAFTNAWAILTDMPIADPGRLAERMIRDTTGLCRLTPFSGYFAARALSHARRYDLFPMLIAPWRSMIDWGLTTCPEFPDFATSRSDCHAWSAGPLVEFTREILGVRPSRPGWAEITIQPRPAGLSHAKGRVPLTRCFRFDGRAASCGNQADLTAPGSPHEHVTAAQQAMTTPWEFVEVDWRIIAGRFAIVVDVPRGIPTRLILPDGTTREYPTGGKIETSCEV